jgi:hypothetical protein
MNNRCLICAIVLLLSPRSGLDLVIDIIVFQALLFYLFGGIFYAFSAKKYWPKTPFHLCLWNLDRLEESRYVPYDCFFRGEYHSIAIDFLVFKP